MTYCSSIVTFYKGVRFFDKKSKYPVCLAVHDRETIFNPIMERIMSLSDAPKDLSKNYLPPVKSDEFRPVFFFIYNTDNYFHFLYDSLPYLLSFKRVRQIIPEIKLLMQNDSNTLYPFVEEALELLDIQIDKDVLWVQEGTIYHHFFVSNSYTHGESPEDPPHPEIFELYKQLVLKATDKSKISHPKKIYVSRRSWIHGNTSNIGTNYTTRRKLVNEDQVVKLLTSRGYEEVFTENMNFVDKINMFAGATHIVGAIGGGISNCLFSNKNTDLLALISPTFLEVNSRFKHCFTNVSTRYFNNTYHIENDSFKKYMRVCHNDIVGEIEEVYEDSLLVYYCTEKVAGWNNKNKYDYIVLKKDECRRLDTGLNSPWAVDLEKLELVVR